MNKVLIAMLVFIAMAAVSNAAIIDANSITVMASDEYVDDDIFMGGGDGYTTAVDGIADHTIDGIGFDERNGFHSNNAFWGTGYDGNMWIAPISPPPSIKFDLKAAYTLTEIKVWNCNSVMSYESSESPRFMNRERLGMGVKDMEVVLYDASNTPIGSPIPYTLAMGPGKEDVDYGQVLDIPDTAGVRYVEFIIQSNHGDAPKNQVGLAEVRFYDDIGVPPAVDAGPDQNVTLVDNTPDPNSIVVTLDGTVTADGAVTTRWSVFPDDPNVVISDVNAIDTTATITGSTGLYYFILDANDGTFSDSDYLKVRAFDGDTGLVFYWPFDEGTGKDVYNAVDTGLYDTHGDFYPVGSPLHPEYGPEWDSDAISGTSLRFEGGFENPDAINLAPSAWEYWQDVMVDPNGTGEVTASVWLKTNKPLETPGEGNHKDILQFFNMHLCMRGTHLRFGLQVGYPYYVLGKTNIYDGQWHLATVTYDGYTAKLYVDGRLDGQYATYEGVIQPGLGISGWKMAIGSSTDGYNPVDGWEGLLDEFKVYNLALDQAQIMAAYVAGGGTPCKTLVAGDLNGDCQVDTTDLTMLAQDWLTCTNEVPGDCF